MFTRREFIAAAGLASVAQARPKGVIVDTHIHLFAKDRARFPLHANAPYDPPPQDLEDYKQFVKASKLDHAVIVHPDLPAQFAGAGIDGINPRQQIGEIERRLPGKIRSLVLHSVIDATMRQAQELARLVTPSRDP